MSAAWQTTLLDALVERDSPITYGVVKPGDPGDVPFVRGGDIADGQVRETQLRTISSAVSQQYKRTLLRGGELLMSLVGQPGQVAVASPSLAGANIARQVGLIRLQPSVDAQFVCHFLRSPDGIEGLRKFTGGSVQQVINLSDLRQVAVPVPPLDVQRRIVSILNKAFEGIATAKAHAEQNLQRSGELFDLALNNLLQAGGADSTERSLADVCEIQSLLVDPRDEPYLDMPHVGAGNIVSKTGELIDVLTARQEQLISGKFGFDESMVLYSKIRPYLMKVVRPDFCGLCSADIYPLVPKPDVITRDYLYYVLLSGAFTAYAIQGSARAGMPKVNREHLFAYRLRLPSVHAQRQLTIQLDALAANVKSLQAVYQRKLTSLTELQQSLVHQAFTGQL